MKGSKILVVEDEAIVALSLKRRLEELGYTVLGPLARGEDAVAQVETLGPDLVLMDIHLAGTLDGVDAAAIIQKRWRVPVVYLTAYAEDATLERARATEPYGYIIKPFDARELHAVIQMVLGRRAAEVAVEQREELLRLALEAADMAAFEIDPASRTLLRSGRVTPLCEAVAGSVTASLDDFLVRIHPEDRNRVEQVLREALDNDGEFDVEFRARTAAGTRWLSANGRIVSVGLVGVVTDVTERRQIAERLRQAAGVFDATADAIFLCDAKRAIISVNRAFTQITGYALDDVKGRTPRMLDSSRHDTAFYREMARFLKESGQWQGELWHQRKNGEVYPAWQTISVIRDEQGHVSHYVTAFSDISALREAETRLTQLAFHDTLTGLPNRALLADRTDWMLAYAERHGQKVALLFLDLDRFKTINDTLGHAAGDQLLQVMAERFLACLREEDTLARLGGDEFVLLLSEIQSAEQVVTVAARLIEAARAPVELAGRAYIIGASIGISLYPDDAVDRHDLLRAADAAMYKAKAAGKNTYAFFDAHLTARAEEELFLESGLRHALAEGLLELHYQPQVTLPDLRIAGVEALVRWRHPDRGFIPPDRFILIAEQTGLIIELGQWVLAHACRQVCQLDAAGLSIPRMAVNLSPRQLQHAGFAETVRRALAETGLSSSRLELEVTESALQHTESALDTLKALRELGVAVAIDDFGTGYSCLGSLKHLPLDRLKIDRSLVNDLPGARNDEAIVAAILAVGRALGLAVIAEGVETESQLAALQAAGCSEIQGYLVGRPMPAEVLVDWLRNRRQIGLRSGPPGAPATPRQSSD